MYLYIVALHKESHGSYDTIIREMYYFLTKQLKQLIERTISFY